MKGYSLLLGYKISVIRISKGRTKVLELFLYELDRTLQQYGDTDEDESHRLDVASSCSVYTGKSEEKLVLPTHCY